jgi:hypothetical protein
MSTKTETATSIPQENPAFDNLIELLAEKVAEIMQSTSPSNKPFLSLEESEAYSDLSGSTLRARVREGRLRKRKNGGRVYFAREDLDKMMVGEDETTSTAKA